MKDRIRAYPMVVLLLPLVAAILICDMFYPLRQPWRKTEPNAMQTELYKRLIASGLKGDELATVGALTLGYKEELPPELRTHFQASGAAHVLAVSGLHTGILYGLVVGLLTLGGRLRPLHENRLGRVALGTVTIGVMWAYAWLTGMTPSVVRAVLMVTIFEVGRMIYRQAFSLNTIAAAAVLILLFKPSDLWSVSFQLSFAATFMIVLVAQECEKSLHRQDWLRTWYGRALSWIAGTVIISIAAQLGTLAISMYYFHQISTYFLLANLLVLPLAGLLVPCGLLSLALGGSLAGIWVSKVTGALAWTMNHSVAWIESLPGSTVHVSIGVGMVAVYYAIILIFCYFFTKST